MTVDLDKGGAVYEMQRYWLGPSLGWFTAPANWTTGISVAGTTTLDALTTRVNVNVAGLVTVQLPSVLQGPYPPGIRRQFPLLIEDTGGNAGAFNITILPFGAELISGLASLVISSNFGSYTLIPRIGTWTFQ